MLELYLKFQINLFEINLGSTEVLEVARCKNNSNIKNYRPT